MLILSISLERAHFCNFRKKKKTSCPSASTEWIIITIFAFIPRLRMNILDKLKRLQKLWCLLTEWHRLHKELGDSIYVCHSRACYVIENIDIINVHVLVCHIFEHPKHLNFLFGHTHTVFQNPCCMLEPGCEFHLRAEIFYPLAPWWSWETSGRSFPPHMICVIQSNVRKMRSKQNYSKM